LLLVLLAFPTKTERDDLYRAFIDGDSKPYFSTIIAIFIVIQTAGVCP
jgi:hypothetical protein